MNEDCLVKPLYPLPNPRQPVYSAGLRLLVVSILVLLSACGILKPVPNELACGEVAGAFLGDWIDYYKRGVSYAQCRDWPKAEADFRAAIAKYDRDQRRAYTDNAYYRYFPNRELGVALYAQGKYDAAIKVLVKALDQFPNAKAEFYLRKARRARFEASGQTVQPPQITVTTPAANTAIAQPQVQVSGAILAPGYAERITLNGRPYRHLLVRQVDGTRVVTEHAAQRVPFTQTVALDGTGHTEVTISVQDLLGQTRTQTLPLVVDQTGPLLLLHEVNRDQYGRLRVRATARDPLAGLSRVRLAGRDKVTDLAGQTEYRIADRLRLEPRRTAPVTLAARDRAGNTTIARLDLDERVQGLEIGLNDDAIPRHTQEARIALNGVAKSDAGLHELRLAERAFASLRGDPQAHFQVFAPLVPGENTVRLTAEDQTGQTETVRRTIAYTLPPQRDLAERLVVGQMPFVCAASAQGCPGQPIAQQLYQHMQARQRFRSIDRTALGELVDTTRLCTKLDPDRNQSARCRNAAEQRLGAEGLVIGKFIERHAPQGYGVELYAQLIDTRTGQVWTATDAYQEYPVPVKPTTLERQTRLLANRIHAAFPLAAGPITGQQGDYWRVAFGRADQVREGMPVRVYRPGPRQAQLCLNSRLSQVNAEFSLVEIEETECEGFEPAQAVVVIR